jgi:hypothetical protein
VLYCTVAVLLLQAHMLSMACAGVLFWAKRAKPAGLLAALRLVVVAHAVLPAAIRWAVEVCSTALRAAVLHSAHGVHGCSADLDIASGVEEPVINCR